MSTPEASQPDASQASRSVASKADPSSAWIVTAADSGGAGPAVTGRRHHALRPKRWAWPLTWSAGLIAAGIALYICYLHVSRTQPVSSDGASNALQAWDMLHGNLLLSGWLLGHVSFYTTELPEYMLVEAIRGLSADALHVSAAITYTLLVLVAGLLARGRATGREGLVRMLIAAGIMVAPQLGPGVFILVFQPDHVGTQVPLLATWLVLDRAPRSWYVPIVVGVMLAWTEVADSFAVLIGAVPLGVVAVVRAYQALVQRREQIRSGWFDLSLVAAAGLSVEVASVAVKLIGDHGGYSLVALPPGLATTSMLSAHVWLAVGGVLGVYGADFFGLTFGLTFGLAAGIALLHLVGVALSAWGLWLVIRRFFSLDDLIAQVLALSIVITLAAYLLSTIPTTYYSARYLAGVLTGGAVLAGRTMAARLMTARMVPALAIVLVAYLAALGYTVSQPSVPAATQDLADWLTAHHLDYGLSSYGLANTTTLASGGVVDLRPVIWQGNAAYAGPSGFQSAWYNPVSYDANYVVLLRTPAPIDWIPEWQVRDSFGRPAHTYDFKEYVIMTWNENLLAAVGPTAPPPAGS